MEPKRELASVDLRALVGELGGYEGAIVDKAYLYGDDLLRLRLRDHDRGRLELLIEVGEQKRIHMADPDLVPDAPGRPPNFAKMLRNRMSGATFEGIEQHGFDRILKLDFERTDSDTSIVAELFGDGNIAVLDENGSVVDSLETVRLHSRTVAPGSKYEYPEARVDPLSLSYEAFVEHMDASDTDVVRTLATQLDLGGEYAEELCARAGVEKELPIAEADDSVYEPVYDALQWLADALETAALDPRVYYADPEDGGGADAAGEGDGRQRGQPVDVTPVPLADHENLASEPHDSFNAAVDAYFHELESYEADAGGAAGEPDRPDFEGEIEKQERIIAQQQEAIAGFEQEAQSLRAAAEALYAQYDLVDELLSTVRAAREEGHDWDAVEERLDEGAERGIEAAEIVASVDPQNARIRVELETGEGDDAETHTAWIEAEEGVEHNADRLYTEAKAVEEKKEGAESAIEDTRERLAEIEQRREEWEARDEQEDGAEAGDGSGGAEDGDEDGGRSDQEWLDLPSIPIRSRDWWYDRFRWFRTSQGFLVIGGRDADQNEELVQKYLEPGDRFLHAQAHGGPVTILKAADPSESGRDVEIPEAAEREAARFAVTYSSVWKEGKFSGDVYAVDHDQVSKTPESGEYLEKGGFAIRGDRTYYDDVEVACTVGIQCEPETRVIGGPPEAIEDQAVTTVAVEPGKFAQGDVGKRIYRQFRERFSDTSFVRKVASPDLIQHFLPPGTSRIAEE
ncbi:Fibronectin-binding A domain protein [Salinarchaeum sp. Harcht-Bsk1]|uniref:ribosome rescue protein RqcH n=1 Tax=Salinarchaeum sp. Harcht-Bsk1 TaxID=1333523 RepID=UPI000342419D|nr:ribosome rescue protein RqcH [Salinarchaeum sp. Harcht-Bsk1]AGN00511.1 Fibronectin-binding A domain protein [Salinarchaeum sp. Harcht-Bsk1]